MTTQKHTQWILLTAVLLLSAVFWLISNNSVRVSRDEMWYASYALELTDAATDDIRHLTADDIHQVAFSWPYRLLQKVFISIAGLNIMGVRLINLFFLLIFLTAAFFLLRQSKTGMLRYPLFAALLMGDTIFMRYMHHGRPEWVMICLVGTSLILLMLYRRQTRLSYLVGSTVTATAALSIYWSGLAFFGAYGLLLFILLLRGKMTRRHVIVAVSVSALTGILLFVLPIVFHINEFRALMNTPVLQTSGLTSGHALLNLPRAIWEMADKTFLQKGVLGSLHFGLFLVFAMLFLLRSKKELPVLMLSWLAAYILFSAFRGAGVRFVYFLLPLLYLLAVFAIPETKQSSRGKKYLAYGCIIFLVVYSIANGLNVLQNTYQFRGQWQAYRRFRNDLQRHIPDKAGRVMTTFDLLPAFPERPLFFHESFNFVSLKNFEHFAAIMRRYNIRYFIVDERSRIRMRGDDEYGIGGDWYIYWRRYLNQYANPHHVVYNRYYRKNKEVPPKDPRGFRNEIWVVKNGR